MIQNRKAVRVRFAPSPTGNLHIGGLRSALFNWLFARHHGGAFLLRIEDTDYERSKPEYTASILDSLSWVGLEPDEPMLIQSSRIDEHRARAEWLVEHGHAYRCICTPEQVAVRSTQAGSDLENVKYDGFCRDKHYGADKKHVIRLRMEQPVCCGSENEEKFVFEDLVRGTVTIPRDQLDDFIIIRSDGSPMYNFVVVVDDAFMEITHIIRGEEHIINTPKQIALYNAFGYTVPHFAHIPLVLGPSGQKLSKREAATAVPDYRDAGYLPDALVNYLVRLGWAHGDQEIFSRKELIQFFSLEGVSKSGAIFDQEKLNWVNTVYLKQCSDEQIYQLLTQYGEFEETVRCFELIKLYKDRVATLKELAQLVDTALRGPAEYAQADFDALVAAKDTGPIDLLIKRLEIIEVWSADEIQQTVKDLAATLNIKMAVLAHTIRLAIIGVTSGPGAFALLAVIGKQEAIRRLYALRSAVVRIL
jgi:glutamyl-tRNA synthetase